MTTTAADKPDDASAVDPDAIDLNELPDLLERLCRWQEWEKTGFNHNLLKEAIAAIKALRERMVELEANKRAPVQGYSAGIPWSMHLRAYDVYCKKYSPQPALVDLEKRNCRGGFGTEELDEFIPGWRDELSETVQLLRRTEAAEARVVEFRNDAIKWREGEELTSKWRDQWEAERARVVELEPYEKSCLAITDWTEKRGWSHVTTEVELLEMFEALEARVVELVGALGGLMPHVSCPTDGPDMEIASDAFVRAHAILSATPAEALERAKNKDQAYLERNHLVAALARLYPSGVTRTNITGWSPDWHGCVYIDLPSGQVSYHYHDSHAYLFEGLPSYQGKFDGHDKEIVHQRLAKLDALGEDE